MYKICKYLVKIKKKDFVFIIFYVTVFIETNI